jgi:hypothetical protein
LSLSFRFTDQNFVLISLMRAICPVHLILFHLITLIIFREHLIIQSSPPSRHFLPLRSRYFHNIFAVRLLNFSLSLSLSLSVLQPRDNDHYYNHLH